MHVVKGSWNDPDDMKPGATRTAKQVTGWRGYDPLRMAFKRLGERSNVKAEHIVAADLLRAAFDGSRIGYSGLASWMPIQSRIYRPSTGPAQPAMKRLRARQSFDKAWVALGTERRHALIAGVVLRNLSVAKVAEMLGISPNLASEQLAEALDVLVKHLDVANHPGRIAA
jgi:hypothetical protein